MELFLGHQEQGNADNVVVIVEVPCKKDIYPDLLIDQKALLLHGRRNGKLRCKEIMYLDSLTYKYKYIDKQNYKDKSWLYKTKEFAKIREQVEKHLSWALLKA